MLSTCVDLLTGFSAADLRELLQRRGSAATGLQAEGRESLVNRASFLLSSPDSNRRAVFSLNTIELLALRQLALQSQPASLAQLQAEAGLEEAALRPVLEQLRLWGLVFPHGNWSQMRVLPPLGEEWYLRNSWGDWIRTGRRPWAVTPPTVAGSKETPVSRPGAFAADLAQFLAAVARRQPKLTQRGVLSRRDAKAIQSILALRDEYYVDWLEAVASSLDLMRTGAGKYLVVTDEAAKWLGQPEVEMIRAVLGADLPAADTPIQSLLQLTRNGTLAELLPLANGGLADLAVGEGASWNALQRRLRWERPLIVRHLEQVRRRKDALEETLVALIRHYYWLGLISFLGDPEEPAGAGRTALGDAVNGISAPRRPVEREMRFVVQPNGEVFSPPNLHPAVLYQLRRFTETPRNAPAGMYSLTPRGLEECMRGGVSSPDILAFLEAHSRHSLPPTVRQILEDAARRCGRVHLIPTSVVLRVDTPELLREIENVPSIASLLGERITERVISVSVNNLRALVSELRRRGYGAVDGTIGITPPAVTPVNGAECQSADLATEAILTSLTSSPAD